jgi:L-lactate dehydrogenase
MACAYALTVRGIPDELVLVDLRREKAEGEAMDLLHGLPFTRPIKVVAGGYADLAGADVVVITAGVGQRPGESRLDLLVRNAEVFRSIVPEVARQIPSGILLVATNPVDILTSIAVRESGLPPHRVIGSGTILDTARFRYLLGQHFTVDPRSVHAYIIGEHGDSEIPVWSLAMIGGVPLVDFARLKRIPYDRQAMDAIFTAVRDAACNVIARKGATSYAIGLGLVAIIETILGDQHTVLSLSSWMEGQHGVHGISLSLPSVLGAGGIEEILILPLNGEEEEGFRASARTLTATFDALGRPTI